MLNNQRADPGAYNNKDLRLASQNGHFNVIKLLLNDSRVDPTTENNYLLKRVVEKGKIKLVKKLLNNKRVKLTLSDKEELIIAAVVYKRFEILRRLLSSQ